MQGERRALAQSLGKCKLDLHTGVSLAQSGEGPTSPSVSTRHQSPSLLEPALQIGVRKGWKHVGESRWGSPCWNLTLGLIVPKSWVSLRLCVWDAAHLPISLYVCSVSVFLSCLYMTSIFTYLFVLSRFVGACLPVFF